MIEEIENLIKDIENLHPYKKRGDVTTYSQYNEGWSDACDLLGNAIIDVIKNNYKKVSENID